MLAAFQSARDDEYAGIVDKCWELPRPGRERAHGAALGSYADLEENEVDLEKLEKWFSDVAKRDAFGAAGRGSAHEAHRECTSALGVYAARLYETVANSVVVGPLFPETRQSAGARSCTAATSARRCAPRTCAWTAPSTPPARKQASAVRTQRRIKPVQAVIPLPVRGNSNSFFPNGPWCLPPVISDRPTSVLAGQHGRAGTAHRDRVSCQKISPLLTSRGRQPPGIFRPGKVRAARCRPAWWRSGCRGRCLDKCRRSGLRRCSHARWRRSGNSRRRGSRCRGRALRRARRRRRRR